MSTRILVARLDKVGDTVLSTPFFHNLRRHYPDADIVALTSPYNYDVLLNNPDITSVVAEGAESAGIRQSGTFDMAIALSPTGPTYRMVADTHAPVRLGLVYASRWPARLMSRWWLTRTTLVDVDGALSRGEPVPHEVRQMLSILSQEGIAVEETPLAVYPTVAQQEAAATMVASGVRGIHLSVRWFTEGWTMSHFLSLLDALQAAFPDDTWLVTHGPAEREYVSAMKPRPGVMMAGEQDFGTWAALIGRCRTYVSTDTGALHVASAMQVPVVAIYENATYTHCSQQWSPWMVPHEKLRKGTPQVTAAAIIQALRHL